MNFASKLFLLSIFVLKLGQPSEAQENFPSLNTFGSPGLIDMPSAYQLPDGTLTATVSYVNSSVRSTLNFQITPRLSGVFRYTGTRDFKPAPGVATRDAHYDRSFDVRYQLAFESTYRPAITVGLQDAAGTGFFSGEYLVATKSFTPRVRVTAGIGWGRFAQRGSFSNPLGIFSDRFDTRPTIRLTDEFNGRPQFTSWFRGPVAPFAGVEWMAPNNKLRLKAEYSSDAYRRESNANAGFIDIKTPLNFSAEYRLARGATLSAHLIAGSELGLRFSTDLNPNHPTVVGREEAPFPIRNRNQTFAQQRALFGDVIAVSDVASTHIGAVPTHDVKQSPSGVRIAHVRGHCDPAAAREIDALQGVIDLVVFENGAGVVDCSVVTRPAGRTYIEAVSARQPLLAQGVRISKTKVDAIVSRLQKLVETDGITIERSDISNVRAQVHMRSTRFNASAQAVGRMARAMTHVLPATVEQFEIILMQEGLAITSVTLQRSDLEMLEHDADGAWKSLARATIKAAQNPDDQSVSVAGLYPKLSATLKPAVETSFFDPDNPFRFDLKARGVLRFDISPGFSLNAQASKLIVGNVGTSTRLSDSVIQHVRSDIGLYQNAGDPTIDRLTADYMFKVSPDVYGRVSGGIFERMYGGVSAELLWAPADRAIAVGAELNWVKQRDYDQLLSFRNYATVTGHASAYWNMGNGFSSQLDVGRYLAKDWGATVSLDRVFNNGWKVGGYFTLTDVSFDDFGEGSFDKGIRVKVPLSWLSGAPTQQEYNMLIQPIYRDGGARVSIPNRLYETIRGHSPQRTKNTWGRVFR
jgi:hypothetical protein